MPVLKYPIGIITLFLAFGIVAACYISITQVTVYAINIAYLIIFVITFWYSKKSFLPKPHFTIVVLGFSFCIGMLLQTLHYPPTQKLHYSNFIHSDCTIKGTISERLKPNEYQERYYFDVRAVDSKAAKGRLLLTVPKDSIRHAYHPGDSFIIAGSPLPFTKPLNPYQFDYASYMYNQGVYHQLKLKDNFIGIGTLKTFDYYIGRLREKLVNSFTIHKYNASIQNTLNALLLGQRQDMDATTNEAYKKAGVLHILAISGLHFSVLFYLLTSIFKPLTGIARHGRLFRFIAILALLWGFAFITGLSASVVRSVVMFSIISLGQYLNRDTNIYNSLAISMLLLLVANPYFIFDAGFQLSYLAVFAIVWLQPFYNKLKLSKHRQLNYFSNTILVSSSAQLGVLPLSLYYFNQFPLLFLIANLVVIPLSNIILIAGLLVLVLNFIWVDAALIIGKLLSFCVETMNGFISWIASFESMILKEIPFSMLLAILLYATIIFFGFWLYHKKNYQSTIAFLCSILFFQIAYGITMWQQKKGKELVVFNTTTNTTLALKTPNSINIISDDSLIKNTASIKAYTRANFNPEIKTLPLQNILWINNKRILIIDEDTSYDATIKPDILLLANSPKVNLERIIEVLKPKKIIANGTNYKSSIKLWKATCEEQKIPFHATAEKGFYTIR